MKTVEAFARGFASRNNPVKVFDWVRAAIIIKERGVMNASAGLADDWEWTGGKILWDGKPVPRSETYTYLASTWATPELNIDGEVIECYLLQSDSPQWDEDTYWPIEALNILGYRRANRRCAALWRSVQ